MSPGCAREGYFELDALEAGEEPRGEFGGLDHDLDGFIDEELFNLCGFGSYSTMGRVPGASRSDDSTVLDLGCFDAMSTDALLMHGDFTDLFSTIPEGTAIVEPPNSERNQRKRNARPPRARAARTSTEKRSVRSTSKFRGVTHHCRTGKFESHVWSRGKQVYLGGFDSEHQAAVAYDLIAIRCRGERAQTNFDIQNYRGELENLNEITEEDLVLSLRRQSKGFNKGSSSRFRGVTRHAKGKFEARIGQIVGKKYRCTRAAAARHHPPSSRRELWCFHVTDSFFLALLQTSGCSIRNEKRQSPTTAPQSPTKVSTR